MTRIARAVLWLALGHSVVGALFWLLLLVPESNIVMLAASVGIVVLLIVVAALVEGTAVVRLHAIPDGRPFRARALSVLIAFVAAGFLYWAIWWLTGRASRWLAVYRGEIDAWLLLRFNVTRTSPLHRGLAWMVTFVRYVIGLSIAAALIATGTIDGVRALTRVGRWAKRAVEPMRLLAVACCWAGLLWAPWTAVYWRPHSMPIAIEPLFVAVKLLVLYVVANMGVALILRAQLPRVAIAPPSTSFPH